MYHYIIHGKGSVKVRPLCQRASGHGHANELRRAAFTPILRQVPCVVSEGRGVLGTSSHDEKETHRGDVNRSLSTLFVSSLNGPSMCDGRKISREEHSMTNGLAMRCDTIGSYELRTWIRGRGDVFTISPTRISQWTSRTCHRGMGFTVTYSQRCV